VEISAHALWPFVWLLLASGLVSGGVAGLLGVGGGIVLVPVLYHVFSGIGIDADLRMHLAVGTSLATVVFTATRSALAHRSLGALDGDLLRAWGPPAVLGAVVGAVVAPRLGDQQLGEVFASVALLVALHMAFSRESWRLSEQPPRGVGRYALGSLVGGLSVGMGLGGGTLGVPIFTLVGVPVHRAVGTAAGLGVLIAVPGLLGFLLSGHGAPGRPPGCVGYVNLLAVALLAPTSVLAAPLGARLAHGLSRRTLRGAFALFLVVTAWRMFVAG